MQAKLCVLVRKLSYRFFRIGHLEIVTELSPLRIYHVNKHITPRVNLLVCTCYTSSLQPGTYVADMLHTNIEDLT